MRLKRNTNASRSLLVEKLAENNARLLWKVTRLEQELARARFLAYHDSLTGLPNRALLLDRLQQAMLHAERGHKTVGLLLLDLDCFKGVNDRLGHNAGDLILKEVAQRLTGCIRSCDTACRYGGDEFVVLLPEIGGTVDVDSVARKISACLSKPHRLGDQIVRLDASLGTAVFHEGKANCTDLIGAADSAMYRAKSRCAAAANDANRSSAAA